MLRAVSRILPAGIALGLLTGCPSDEPADGPGGGAAAAYVAIGDSYSAGPSIGPPDGDDNCLRSTNNYPHLVAEQADLDLTDVSCSGATSEAVEGGQPAVKGTRTPQIDALGAETDVVTVRIGVNDFNLIGRIVINCVALGRTDPSGAPCTERDSAMGANSIARRLPEVQDRLTAVLEAIRSAAPGAQVLVVGYPQIFPPAAGGGCAALPLAAGDLPLAREFNEGINTALAEAAEKAGAEFIDVFAKTEGHDICGDDPWVAGAVPDGAGLAWHPYADEHALVTDLVLAAMS